MIKSFFKNENNTGQLQKTTGVSGTSSKKIIQSKLEVSKPDDKYEKEADMVADNVMRMPEPNFVQRKCAHCEEEEKKIQRKPVSESITPFIQTKSEVGSTVSDSLSNKISSSQGTGSNMDSNTQSFMSSRFGNDFNSVKIHTDGNAIQMNRELNAKAFTTGNDIYFNEGQYQPHTSNGKQLLAHELTHTIQQNRSVKSVQNKKDTSFEITGLYESRAGESGFIFFDTGQPDTTLSKPEDSLDKDEKQKIKDKAKANPPTVNLFGFSSEDGIQKEDNELIGRRVSAVKNVLIAEGYDSTKIDTSKSNQRNLGRDHYDFRFWRAVEMADGKDSTRKAPAGSSRGIAACGTSQATLIEKLAKDADSILKKVDKRLNDYVADPTKDAALAAMLDTYFKNTDKNFVKDKLAPRFKKINDFVNKAKKISKCGTQLSQDCGDAIALTGQSEMILCDGFFSRIATEKEQTYIMIHESGHGSSTTVGDRGYRHERVFLILTTSQALQNADSYATLAEEVNEGKASGDIVSDKKDDTTSCDTKPDLKKKVKEAIAWVNRLNLYAQTGIAQTYGNAGNTAAMSPFFMAHFGRTDKVAMAGIQDRYLKMEEVLNQSLTFKCKDQKDTVCATSNKPVWTISGEVTVCPDQLSDSVESKRVNNMYAGLAAIMPGVTTDQQFSYPKLARNYKTEFWQELG
jgi:hypothetical protein